ncbi:MAG: hypothetical protein DRO40_10710 [Thermoprotei archaeon]|nr:MAG: hypothetical protein DRO40_10710 [Thermoprotei archaeon]
MTSNTLLVISQLLFLAFGIIYLVLGLTFIIGAPGQIKLIGLMLLAVFSIYLILIFYLQKIKQLINQGKYEKAKSWLMPLIVFGFITSILLGLVLLITYFEIDKERKTKIKPPPPLSL